MPYQTMLSTDNSTHNHETSKTRPSGPLKDHILVLLGSQEIRRLVGPFWLWRSVPVPLCGTLFPQSLQLRVLRRGVSLLLVRDLRWVSTWFLKRVRPRHAFLSL